MWSICSVTKKVINIFLLILTLDLGIFFVKDVESEKKKICTKMNLFGITPLGENQFSLHRVC